MSTRIEAGFRLASDTDVLTFASVVRPVLSRTREELMARWLTDALCTAVDDRALACGVLDARGTVSLATTLVAEHERAQHDLNPARRDHDPFSVEVSVGRTRSGMILGIVHAPEPAYLNAVMDLPQVQEYGYWNHTDRPEHLTDDQWEMRGEAWAEVCPGAPAETMVTVVESTPAGRTVALRRLARDAASGARTLPAPVSVLERGARRANELAAQRFVEGVAPGAQLFSTYVGALSRYQVDSNTELATLTASLLTSDPRTLASTRPAGLPVASADDLAALRLAVGAHIAQRDAADGDPGPGQKRRT